jgi:hypothetical protein
MADSLLRVIYSVFVPVKGLSKPFVNLGGRKVKNSVSILRKTMFKLASLGCTAGKAGAE